MIHCRRNRRTDQDLINAGDFVKVGRKHYRHVSGAEIVYDCNRWRWSAVGQLWQTLDVAAYYVRKQAAEAPRLAAVDPRALVSSAVSP